ncbi:excinuclease ABC subunit UvrA [Sneathiella sp. HT1-7]|uniref:excinuclease ABC subunit UvrA n=1 Tax=Sneathiella sp. HT1-7 TaxID=2887192 RepID=UPI001D13F2EE|nr:excinuclease ABC subunit UvrA [Sneathiella sp. HT1-7]MCC3305015.1 excinuclease ABC subunit UvrA [Sneathiella sp. HT1-7]
MQKILSIRGAREHNLQNVNIDIPRDQLVVITGLSGSGKSSLAFDTIYAEGQRRYVESLSAYARQFLEMMQKPDVDHIDGLSPAISIEQKTTSKNPRSTVGTVTEIYDYLRLLYARIGVPYSPATGLPIASQTVSQMVDQVMAKGEGKRLYLLAPIVRGRKGEYRKEFLDLRKRGFQRVKVDGEIYDIEDTPELDMQIKHHIDVVVDRVVLNEDIQGRLADSIETALDLADGLFAVEDADTQERTMFSSKFACPVSGFTIEEIEPRIFSFNNPYGACTSCGGLGTEMFFDPDQIVPDVTLSMRDGAIAPWSRSQTPAPYYMQTLEALAKHYGFMTTEPWEEIDEEAQKAVLFGTGETKIQITFDDGLRTYKTNKPFEGVIPNIERRWRETDSSWVREDLEKYQDKTACSKCGGHRLKEESLAIRINGHHIGEVCAKSILDARKWFEELSGALSKKDNSIAERVLKEINERLGFLVDVGLEYLTLSRGSGTLSGGESQRIRLASQIGSGLTGVLYVLDEPSIGLHQRDNARLLKTLVNLRDQGNSVIVVEHDEEAIMTADHVVDMGPRAGRHGGRLIAQGSPDDIMKEPESITGKYLSGEMEVPLPKQRRRIQESRQIHIIGARHNNLKRVNVNIPLGTFTCVTGVSGGGKSSLIIETLYKAIAKKLNNNRNHPGPHDRIEGIEWLDKIVDIDQSPIGRTPRSNPATYTGAFTPIREWFAGLPEAKARGYKSGRFSFNVKGGRCEACKGDGVIKIEMHFLPDVYVQCDVCKGERYNRETLEIKFKDKSISDVLNMTVDDAAVFFKAVPNVREKFETLQQVGLGYIHVGQQATTLSGGEAQRVKLAKELSRRATGRTLYILDEPTTGLHFEDVRKLMEVLQALVDAGNSVLVIEHNLEVIKTADWVVDMGPDGGDAGGYLVAEGTPEEVAKVPESYTGRYLKDILAKRPAVKPAEGTAKKTKKTKAA